MYIRVAVKSWMLRLMRFRVAVRQPARPDAGTATRSSVKILRTSHLLPGRTPSGVHGPNPSATTPTGRIGRRDEGTPGFSGAGSGNVPSSRDGRETRPLRGPRRAAGRRPGGHQAGLQAA